MKVFIITMLLAMVAPYGVAHAASEDSTTTTVVVDTGTPVPVPAPVGITTITGPATVVEPVGPVAEDVCLSSGDQFNPGAGTMSRSLLPCTIVITGEVTPVAEVGTAVGPGNVVLPVTGGNMDIVGYALILIAVGILVCRFAKTWRYRNEQV